LINSPAMIVFPAPGSSALLLERRPERAATLRPEWDR